MRERTRVHLIPLAFGACLLATVPARCAEPDPRPDPGDARSPSRFQAFPDAEFYPQYIADPLRPQSALILARARETDIPQAGESMWALRLGGRFGLLRWHPEDRPGIGVQLDFEGGFFAHFDLDNGLDNTGWDGLLGLTVSWKPSAELALRFGRLHDSAHLGDEYIERTGASRRDATREEWILGASWSPEGAWRLYGELGLSSPEEEFQEPARVQAGVEYLGSRRFFGTRMTWYAAADLRAMEEWDWDTRVALQLGWLLPTGRGTSRYRFAIEAVDGRSVLGELARHDESWVGIGWYFDF